MIRHISRHDTNKKQKLHWRLWSWKWSLWQSNNYETRLRDTATNDSRNKLFILCGLF